jgi:DNA repair protein RecN (Recombination protein N)
VETSLIRTGTDSAQVSGVFALAPNSPARSLLSERGIAICSEVADEVILRRVIQRSGRHRAFVNDVPVSARTLQEVAEELIDISSQFENQRLLDVRSHTTYLDSFCGVSEAARGLLSTYEIVQSLLTKIHQAEDSREKRLREKDLCEFELAEISAAKISEEEFSEIETVLAMARKTGAVNALCQDTLGVLVDSDVSCFSLLQHAKKNMEKLERLTEGPLRSVSVQVFGEALATLDAAVDEVRAAARVLVVDEERLAWAQERIEIYNKLLRKFGPSVASVLLHAEKCSLFLREVEGLDDELETLTRDALQKIDTLIAGARSLSRARRAAPDALSQKVRRELSELGMTKARFVCEFVEPEERKCDSIPVRVWDAMSPQVQSEFLRIGKRGAEEARFLLSANAGIDPQNIEKVASGGELSRVMLAIKTILFAGETVNLFVFDEIDTGISGNVAAKVGRKLAHFCKNRQAVCITHLPQVACYADSHFVAKKFIKDGKTVASIISLPEIERAHELASMLSGERVTEEGLAQARALLKEARA